jgi:hypothetical protein
MILINSDTGDGQNYLKECYTTSLTSYEMIVNIYTKAQISILCQVTGVRPE